jgi:NAD(P)-dependent dehydrogenase (short-subunit alcohol dehydrogenase family)
MTNSSDKIPGTVIITGANGNLGTAVTNEFLNKGYKVIATVTNEEAKNSFISHPDLHIEVIDLTDEEKTNVFIQNTIEKHGNIDGALLLVGGFAMGDITSTRSEDIRKQFSLNFDTAYHIVQPLYQHMINNDHGRIVFIGSRPALEPSAGKNMIAYGLSKSLLFKLADYLNAHAKGKNVSVSVVAPSTLDTPANRKSMPDADPDKWVKTESLAEILEFIISEKGAPLRQTVLKVYNNA